MSRKIILAAAFAVAFAAAAGAQAFAVSYLDGTAEVGTARSWKTIAIGDTVPADGSVRVSQNGSLELTRGTLRITILRDGVYDVAVLARSAGKDGSMNLGSTLTQKLASLTTERSRGSQAAGVRGEMQAEAPVTWMDENDQARGQAQTLLDEKKFSEALKVLDKAIRDSTEDTDRAELMYLMGVAYYGSGQTARAYRVLEQISPDPETGWYSPYVILKSQVLVDTFNFKDALAVLSPFISAFPAGEAAQMAYLLTFYSQKGLGDPASAQAALESGYALDPSTDTARLIRQQMKAR